jgi:Uma2 family endonuclease
MSYASSTDAPKTDATAAMTPAEVIYPDCDGNPMSDNTEQFRWIVMIKENLEILFANNIDVFVAGDLLWYPVEGDNKTRMAPDAMVIFGRPKGRRGSYQQWNEQNIAPQVAFEILSPNNYQPEMNAKRQFYETYGVQEYYVYDPDRKRFTGWIRQGNQLIPIANLEGWVSPLMGIRFSKIHGELEISRPDGRRFLTSVQMESRTEQAIDEAQVERERAEAERERAETERDRADRLATYLRSIGIDPDQLPDQIPDPIPNP